MHTLKPVCCSQIRRPSNGGVDAAARIHSSIAGLIMVRNTLPPLASNDLLCRDCYSRAFVEACQATTCHLPERRTYIFVKRQSSSTLLPLTVRVRCRRPVTTAASLYTRMRDRKSV